MTTQEKLKKYLLRTPLTQEAVGSMIGMTQPRMSQFLGDSYPYSVIGMKAMTERYFDNEAKELESISEELKRLSVMDYGIAPDFIVLRRMRLHKRRSEILNKSRIQRPAKTSASLKQAV